MRDEIQRNSQRYEQNVSEMNSRLIEKDLTIAEKTKLIQARDATINDQLLQIMRAYETDKYKFKEDLFSGIFDGLSKKLGMNLADSSDVDVTASSYQGSSYDPKNVLKNDGRYWHSQNLPNSWIQFDFKQRKVSITSYSMKEFCLIRSWKVEGSTDGSTFEIIDNKVDTTDFQNSSGIQKNFPVQPNNKYYRYIRITSTSKNWDGSDFFILYRVEFFGFVQSE